MRPFLGAHDRIVADDADVNILVLGDSTTESYDEWAGLFAQWLGTQYPTHTVEWEAYWNSGAEDWGDTRTVSTGSGSNTIKVWVAAGGGFDADDLIANEAGFILHASAVDYVAICMGENGDRDALYAMVQSDWPNAYITLITRNPTTTGAQDGTQWDSVRTKASDYGFGLVDVERKFISFGDYSGYMYDTVHPNAAGAQVYADLVETAFLGGAGMVAIAGKTPELLLQAKNYGGSGDWLDESGNGHNASISGALFKPFSQTPYVYLPRVNGNFVSTTGVAGIAGDLDIEAKVAANDWTPSAPQYIVTKYHAGDCAYLFGLLANGKLQVYLSTNGTSLIGPYSSTVATGLADGEAAVVRVTVDVDNDASGFDVTFYVNGDQLGDVVTTGGAISLAAGSEPVRVGAHSSSGIESWGGDIYYVEVRDGIDGTVSCRYDARDATEPFSTQVGSVDGRTWTYNRSGSGLVTTVIDRAMFLLTTNDNMEIADDAALDFAADEALTAIAVVRPSTVAAGQDVIVAKKDDLTTAAGWALVRNAAAGQFIIADGTADDDDTAGTMVANTLYTVAGVRNVTDDDLEAFVDGTGSGSPTTDSTTATLANALPVRIGSTSGTAANFWEGQIVAVALFREALTDQQIRIAGTLLTNDGIVDPVGEQLHGEALKAWIVANDARWTSTSSPEIVGLLNELNGTSGVEYAQARATYLSVDPAG